jgi:hypothetical protein
MTAKPVVVYDKEMVLLYCQHTSRSQATADVPTIIQNCTAHCAVIHLATAVMLY